jgi:prephenate dehydratase
MNTISIQGNAGSFHHIVASRLFGEDAPCLWRRSFREVMADAAEGRADVAVMAIENSIAGSLIMNYDLLSRHPVPIVGDVVLHIGQHLIVHPEAELADITEVWSHPMAIEQCRQYLDRFPHWTVVEQDDTAGSVAAMRDSGRRDVAVISSDYSAQLYGMRIAERHIETDPQNYTRFLILSKMEMPSHLHLPPTRASFRFRVSNEPGSLLRVLSVFDGEGINLSKLESRPVVGSPWQYQFFCDASIDEAYALNGGVEDLMEKVLKVSLSIDLLGCYPDWSSIDLRTARRED